MSSVNSKQTFLASKKWKDFRVRMFNKQNGRCPVCGMKLGKTANLHHMDLNPENYEDISNEDNFVFLCHSCHQYAHRKYKAWVRQEVNLQVLENIWQKMSELNIGE